MTHLAARQIDDRLIVHHQTGAIDDRIIDRRIDPTREQPFGIARHGFVEHHHVGVARSLGAIHSDVGLPLQRLQVIEIVGARNRQAGAHS